MNFKMNKIKGLIIKDFLNLASYKSTVLFIIILFGATSLLNNSTIKERNQKIGGHHE